MTALAVRRVHECRHLFEAHFILSVFAQHGIMARLRNEELVGLAGAVPMNLALIEVWVPAADVERAEAILAELAAPDPEQGRLSLSEGDDAGQLSVEEREGRLSDGDGDE